VTLLNQLPAGVTGKDVIVALCGTFNKDEVLNSVIEFTGAGVDTLSVDERLAISNMTTEWGALAGVFPVDSVLREWYEKRIEKWEVERLAGSPSSSSMAPVPMPAASSSSSTSSTVLPPPADHSRINMERLGALFSNPLRADPGAQYASQLTLDLATLVPHVSGPNSVKVSTPLPVLAKDEVKIDKAYLVSCTNSRASDIAAAAAVVKGRQIAPGVEFYIAAASTVVQAEAEAAGDWAALVDFGAKVLPAGCGPCIGLGTGLLEEGQVGISATNRNYKGRMGHPNALAYLASPAVVAASAVKGVICGPDSLDYAALPQVERPTTSFERLGAQAVESTTEGAGAAAADAALVSEAVLEGFPEVFAGPLLFAPQDNLNTDGIYPGKYT
jgi:homoaconitate hydratase